MTSSLPPSFNSAIFNTSAFNSGGYLTKAQADLLYLPYSTYNLINAPPGTVVASKAVIVDANKDISSFNNLTAVNLTGTIQTTAQPNITSLNAATLSASGIISFTNSTASTSNSIGSLKLTGGLGISNSTDAVSSINGGSFTTAGGVAIAKKLYVGTDLTVGSSLNISGVTSITNTTQSTAYTNGCLVLSGGLGITKDVYTNGSITNNGTINATTIDTLTNNLVYPLTINHLLSSGSPSANNFGIGMTFSGPNASNSTISYGRIYSTCQLNTAGLHQGSLTLSSVIAGNFVDVMTISSLTSSTNNLVSIAGATSVLSVYHTLSTLVTGTLQTAAQPNITSLNAATLTASGIITFTNTSVSTTSTSNAVQISGGLYMDKAIRNNSYYNCHTQNNAATSYATSPQAICLRDQAIYFRNQNGGDTNHGLMYSGSGNANWNSSAGFASKSIDGPVLFGNTGVLLGSVQSGTQVAALSCISGNTNIYGTCFINSPPTMANQSSAVQIQSFGYCLTLANTATYYTRLGTDGGGNFTIETNTAGGSGGYTSHIFSAGSLGLGLTPRFRLDFGNTANDFIIALYNGNNLLPTYGFGANGSAMMYHSAGSNGHKWYINTTGGVGSPNTVGTTVMTLTTSALTIPAGRIFMTVNGYGFSHFSGSGVEINTQVDGNVSGSIGCYSNHPFYIRTNDSSRLYITAGGLVGIGTNSPACNLHVNGTTGQTTSSGFGWLSSAGTGTATGFTNRQFSIRCSGAVMCDSGEINVLSDIRLKGNIKKLDDKLCDKFIDKIDPIEFNYNVDKKTLHYGFSAQQLMQYGFTTLVGFTQDDNDALQELIVDCENGDTIKLEKHTRLIVNMLDMIPILMNVIKRQKDKIDNIDYKFNKLIDALSPGIAKKFNA